MKISSEEGKQIKFAYHLSLRGQKDDRRVTSPLSSLKEGEEYLKMYIDAIERPSWEKPWWEKGSKGGIGPEYEVGRGGDNVRRPFLG